MSRSNLMADFRFFKLLNTAMRECITATFNILNTEATN